MKLQYYQSKSKKNRTLNGSIYFVTTHLLSAFHGFHCHTYIQTFVTMQSKIPWIITHCYLNLCEAPHSHNPPAAFTKDEGIPAHRSPRLHRDRLCPQGSRKSSWRTSWRSGSKGSKVRWWIKTNLLWRLSTNLRWWLRPCLWRRHVMIYS